MNVEVVSVSRTPEPVSQTASAIFVITQKDIQQSGATNIPDLLRMVPGVDVAQINANTWAVSVRGFNGRLSDELLVLVDGRTVYTPTFAGVFWDTLDLPLEDIERIEVIRGPGGSAWGSNAVNGVINIITKKASDSHGALLVGGGGNTNQGFGTAQYGGAIKGSTDYRVYTKYLNQDHSPDAAGQDGGDGWHMLRSGFRVDSTISTRDTLTVQGDIYTAREGTPTNYLPLVTSTGPQPIELLANESGGFIQGVWNHSFSAQSQTSLQLFYDTYQRQDILQEGRHTIDVDFQHHFSGWTRQSIVWGFRYSNSRSSSNGGLLVSLVPPNPNNQLFSLFIQDEIPLVLNRVFLTVGARVEKPYYAGADFMPSVRVAWTPTPGRTIWAAISKADRSPSEFDTSVLSNRGELPEPGGILAAASVVGNPNVGDEGLIAYELGFRTTIRKKLSIDIASYYNDYSHQETLEPEAPFFAATPPPPHLQINYTYGNLMYGETHGLEGWLNWQATARWSLSPGYALEQIHMHVDATSGDFTSVAAAQGSSPVNSAQLRSHLRLGHGFNWDASAYFVDRITDPSEPSSTRVDTQLNWAIRERTSISFVGQNLLRDTHEEYVDTTGSARTTQVKRSAYIKFTERF